MLWLLILTIPHGDALEVTVDVQEVNVVVSNDGDPQMVQVIFRDLAEVRDWRMVSACGMPAYDFATGCWRTRWIEKGTLIEVKSAAVLYSMSEEDRELEAREWLPECRRKRINR